jgi:hypothetical protein
LAALTIPNAEPARPRISDRSFQSTDFTFSIQWIVPGVESLWHWCFIKHQAVFSRSQFWDHLCIQGERVIHLRFML